MTADVIGESRPPVLRIGLVSFVGTALEFYSVQVYGTAAALVFPKLFFPHSSPLMGALLAYGTLAVSYASRPLGAAVFGHVGDRFGRKNALVATLVVMGVATVGIGLLPGFATIGIAAPILLLFLALVQAGAFGGEWGGAILVAYENAPPGRRNLWASLPQVGMPLGALIANAIWVIVTSAASQGDLMSWGWRVPFWFSGIVVIGGVIVRLTIGETPEFQEVKATGTEAKVPVVEMFRQHWREALLTGGAFLGFGLTATVCITYMIQYGTAQDGGHENLMLDVVMISTAIQLVVMPLGGWLADRFGTGRILQIGALGTAVTIFGLCWLVSTGQFALMLIGYVVGFAFFSAINYGPLAALFAAAFSVRTRYSGLSVGQSVANVLGGLGPIASAAMVAGSGTIMSAAGYMCVMLLISSACLLVLTRKFAGRVAGREPDTAPASQTV